MSTASNGDSQVVLLRFGVVADDGIDAELAKITRAGQKAQETLAKGQRLPKVDTTEAEKSLMAYWAKVAQQMDRDLADREKKQMAWGAKLAAQLDRETKIVAAELDKQRGLYEANRRLAIGALQDAAGGFEKLARGLTLLGVAEGSSLEKSIKVMAAFEGTIGVAKGLYGQITNLSTAYKALGAAQQAAGAAQAISGIGGAAAAGTAAAGGVAASGAAAGGAAAGAALGGAAIMLGSAAAALLGAGFALTMAASSKARAGVAGVIEDSGLADPNSTTGMILGAGGKARRDWQDTEKKLKRMQMAYNPARAAEMDASAAGERDSINKMQQASLDSKILGRTFEASASKDSNSAMLSANTDNRADIAKAILDAERQIRETKTSGAQEQAAAAANMMSLLEKQKAAEADRLSINKQISQEALDSARTTKDSLVAQYNAATALADKLREQSLSAEERFGQMDAVSQKRVLDAKRKADAGGELTREESAALRGFTDQANDQARQQDIARGRKVGGGEFADLFLKPNQQNEQSARSMAVDLQTNINTQNEIIVKLEANSATLAAEITAMVRNITREQIALFRAETQKNVGSERFEQAEKIFSGQAARAN